ncbi:hypothetical protein NT01EI_3434 [Edwardsiella ictaluri 93-146]|uniref:Uncharacterized protein n=1 Tax=Edwardsiella ictaluri (strain 93-146) TaxID=634503 RepID=C5BBW4_EDWI9|nr:hypothetical protein NT01EI_3434 [Edwardsiella ictaluri 93-146]
MIFIMGWQVVFTHQSPRPYHKRLRRAASPRLEGDLAFDQTVQCGLNSPR